MPMPRWDMCPSRRGHDINHKIIEIIGKDSIDGNQR